MSTKTMTAATVSVLLLSPLARGDTASTAPSPQGHWDFTGGEGGALPDKSGNKNDGKIQGGTWIKLPDGQALSLNGQTDHVILPATPFFYNVFEPTKTGTTWSIEMWVKMLFDKPFTAHQVPYYQIRLGIQMDNGGDKQYAVVIHRPTGGGVSMEAQGPAGSAVVGEWTHLVATFLTAGLPRLILFKNSVEIARNETPSDPTAVYGNWPTGAALGCLLNTGSYGFNGAISEVRIYGTSLSADEVKARYNERAEKLGLRKAP